MRGAWVAVLSRCTSRRRISAILLLGLNVTSRFVLSAADVIAPRVRARQLLADAVEHLGVGLQVGVADLAVQPDNLLQLSDRSVEFPRAR